MSTAYIFDDTDREMIKLGMHLLAKIWQSELLAENEKSIVASIGSLLNDMPDCVHDYFNASLTLTGPRRNFGENEIYHYWTIESQDGVIQINSGGHFYRKSTGGDSFTSFIWRASPGSTTDCRDFSSELRIVDDAQPFGTEVLEIDLTEPGYSLRVDLEDESLDDDVGKYDGLEVDNGEADSVQYAVCLWAFLDADSGMIYALAGRVYSHSGSDEEILSSLRVLSRHDFRTVQRHKVPSRFAVSSGSREKQTGLAPSDALNDPNAMLFHELYEKLEADLPPLIDFVTGKRSPQSIGDDPIACRTLVYEDANGNCRAIVTEDDREWLATQMDRKTSSR